MSTGYIPREGTVAHQAIEHLKRHGGTLTSGEIAQLFCSGGNATNAMRKALDAGLVAAEKIGHSYTYSLPEAETPADPAAPLKIASYNDGDVSVCGGVECEGGYVVYTRAQIEQLVRHVTTPHVVMPELGAA